MSAALSSDRRRHDRMTCEIPLTGRNGRQQAQVTAVDLSLTGARVVIPGDWRGQWITLSGEGLRKNANSTVRCQVVWQQVLASGEVLAGIHFLEDPTKLGPTWVNVNLRRQGLVRRRQQYWAVPCDRLIQVGLSGCREMLEGRLVSLSAAGAELEDVPYWPIGTQLRLELPARFQAQVIGQARKSGGWRISLQLLLAEDSADQRRLQGVLQELQAERKARM